MRSASQSCCRPTRPTGSRTARASLLAPEVRAHMRYLHTMVRVSDLEASLDFYCNKLGLIEIRRMENEKGRFTLVFLATPEDARRIQQGDAESPVVELTYNWDEKGYSGGRNFGH